MEDHFTFESRYRGTRSKLFRIRNSDNTEWTVFDQWLTTQRKNKIVLQRLTFRKENFYDKCYRINLEIKSACSSETRTIRISKKAKPVLTKIIITPTKFKEIKVKKILKCPCKNCLHGRQFIYTRELSDIFRYEVSITRLHELPDDPSTIPQRERLLALSDQMSSMLENGHFSDFVIHCCNSKINVHKNILSARVPYFRTLLSSGMAEALRNRVHFDDINITVLREMLHYVYSGVLRPVTLTVVVDLFALSDQFQMGDLTELCSQIMRNHISYHNAACFLNLAERYRVKSLKHSCVQFIARNFFEVKHFDREFVNLDEGLLDLIEGIKNAPDPFTNPRI